MLTTKNLVLAAVIIALIVLLYYMCGRKKTEGLGCDANMYTAKETRSRRIVY